MMQKIQHLPAQRWQSLALSPTPTFASPQACRECAKMSEQGKYIVIEGQDATGKSTQLRKLQQSLGEHGVSSFIIEEPGGTPMADKLRALVKNGEIARNPLTNLWLFTAARSEVWHDAKQHLAKGEWVLAARNYFSTLAYQGYGEGIPLEKIEEATKLATDERYLAPDKSFVLHLSGLEERTQRIQHRGKGGIDFFESKEDVYQHRVAEAYLKIAEKTNSTLVDASETPDAVAKTIWQEIAPFTNNKTR